MKRINNLDGFSLMEMMVVLLIVAIVMAASAPMISRKMIKASENSPWLWLTDGNIGYNIGGDRPVTAIIGASTPSNNKPRFYIKSEEEYPQIVLDHKMGGGHPLNISYMLQQKSLGMTTEDITATDTIAIGYQASAGNESSIVIGNDSVTSNQFDVLIGGHIKPDESMYNFNDPEHPYTNVKGAVVVGYQSNAGEGATAVGPISYAYGDRSVTMGIAARTEDASTSSIAIGENAQAKSRKSVLIGSDTYVEPTADNVTEKMGLSVAIGHRATVKGNSSIAIGSHSLAEEGGSIALGPSSLADGGGSMALGDGATVHGSNSVAIGQGVTVSDDSTIAIGHTGHRILLGGNLYSSSDKRLKNVGDVYKGGLNELKKLEFFHYTYKKDTNQTPHVGVIAQDLQKVFPEAVVKGKDGFLRIRQEDMFYAAINAIKELDAKITALTKQVKSNLDLITKLQNKVTEQENQITELKKQNQEFEKRLAKLEKHSAK